MPGPTMFSVYGRIQALPGRRDDVIALIHEGVRAGGDDTGLLTYSVTTALDDVDALWVTELWTDKQAHDTTADSEPVAAVTRRIMLLLAEPPIASYGHAVYVHRRTAG
jgi:quinol monooxygenase YgiN